VAVEAVGGETHKFRLPPTATVLLVLLVLEQCMERDAGFKSAEVKLHYAIRGRRHWRTTSQPRREDGDVAGERLRGLRRVQVLAGAGGMETGRELSVHVIRLHVYTDRMDVCLTISTWTSMPKPGGYRSQIDAAPFSV
jgi:hypothetical protein